MKKIFVVLLLSLLSVQQMSAQKWLKVLGEVASAVLSDDNASVQTKAIPNCIVKFTACEANGNDVTISFTVENQTGKELELMFSTNNDAWDNLGENHRAKVYIGNQEIAGYPMKMPSEVPVKCRIEMGEVDTSATSIKSCSIKGTIAGKSYVMKLPVMAISR